MFGLSEEGYLPKYHFIGINNLIFGKGHYCSTEHNRLD